MSPHPLLDPAITTLRDALAHQPASPEDLSALLRALNCYTGDSLLAALAALLDHLAETTPTVPGIDPGARSLAASYLTAAAELLGPVAEHLDKARALLPGRWVA